VRGDVEVAVFSPEPGPMGVAGPEMSAAVRQMVEGRGILYRPQHRVESVDPDARTLRFHDGSVEPFDFLVYVPPHVAPEVVREAGLTDDSGWIPVDRGTLETRYEGVYAIGDVTNIPLKLGKPLPMAGVFAEREAMVVGHNIAREISGGEPTRYDGHGECFVETGGGKAGFGRGNFYAEPTPQVRLHPVGRRWHLSKVLFEKTWFRRWL